MLSYLQIKKKKRKRIKSNEKIAEEGRKKTPTKSVHF